MSKNAELATVDESSVALVSALSGGPQEVINKAIAMATPLAEIVRKADLVKKIGDKEYVEVEGWNILGAMCGVLPQVEWTRRLPGEVVAYECRVSLINASGRTISSAESMASGDEYVEQDAKRKCPNCGAETLVFSKAAKFGPYKDKPSFWCGRRDGGCGENFAGSDPRIVNQPVGKIKVPSPWTRAEFSIRSMAQTRATGKAFRLTLAWVMRLAGFSPTPLEEMPGVAVEAEAEVVRERPEGEAVAAGVGPTGTRAPQQPDTPAQAASSTGATLDYATLFRETMEAHYRVKFRGPGAGERLTRAVNAVAQQAGLPIKVESWKDCSPADWQSLALAAKAYVDSKRAESGTDAAVTDDAPPAASNRWHDNTPVEAETALAEAATRAMNATLEEAAEADKALSEANLAAKRAARRAMYASPEGLLKACEEAERKLFKANISHQFVFPVGGVPYFIDGDILDACGMTSPSGIDIETLTDDERILLRDEVEKFVARRLA